jgi:peptidoglycan/LPS O-acetylase OafA/YrhL
MVAIPAAVLGTLLTIMLGFRLPAPLSRLAVYLGQASMAIYLTHVIIIAGARIALQNSIGLTDPMILVPGLTLLGLAGGAVARELGIHLGIARWTGLE